MRSTVRWSVGVGAVLFALTLAGLVGGGRTTAAAEPKAMPPQSAPNLGPVPAEGFAVLSVNVAKLHDSAAGKPLREALEKGDKAMLHRIETDFGLALADLDRVTFYWPHANYNLLDGAAATFVTTRKPLDKAKLFKSWRATTEPSEQLYGQFGNLANLGGQLGFAGGKGCRLEVFPGSEKKAEEQPKADDKPKPLDLDAPFYYSGRHSEMVLIPLDENTVVFVPAGVYTSGNPGFLAALLRRKVNGPLAEALALTSKHDVTMAVSGKHLREQFKILRETPEIDPLLPCCRLPIPKERNDIVPLPAKPKDGEMPADPFTPYEPLAEIDRAVFTFDFGPTCTLTATAHFPTDDAAKKAEPVATKALAEVVEHLTAERKKLADDPTEKDWLPVYDFALGGLKAAKVKRDGKTLSATATADIVAELKTAFASLPAKVQEAADKMRTHNNLKQIAAAIQNYHDSVGEMPKDVTDENGKVILSWRVQLLPYLDANDVNAKIDRTKPWDDPVNKKLWEEMPDCFKIPHRPTKDAGQTHFQTFRTVNWIGKDDPWLVDNHKTMLTDITDGTAHTAGVFEMAEPTNWMKPGDPSFDPKKLPAVGNPKTGKITVVMLDQTIRVLDAKKYTGEKLAAIITGNGGEEVDENDFK